MSINTVLVVDDSTTELKNLTEIVTDAGFRAVIANTGRDAITKARGERPDLIFMDIIMPDMDGYEACRELTSDATTQGIPVVFVSSKHQKADKTWAQMQGGKGFVSKPYSADQIIDQIQAFQ